jgi:hypothetical protein
MGCGIDEEYSDATVGGVSIPRLGLGVFRAAADGETTTAVRSACAPGTSD